MSENRTRARLGWVGLFGALGLGFCLFTLDAREVAVVTSFGAHVETVMEPGLHLRLPWPIHEVHRFDSRARTLAVEPTEVLTRDKKNLVVEAFTLWRIADPLRFLEAVETAETAEDRLSDLVTSRLAAGLGKKDFDALLSTERGETPLLDPTVHADVAKIAQERLGVEVVALRLGQLGLPLQNEQSIYERMRAERKRIANAYRSEGEEQAITIRARADREGAELAAAADRQAANILAKAEAEAARVHAEAYAADPGFYRFLRTLDGYRAWLDDDTVLILETESGLLKELEP